MANFGERLKTLRKNEFLSQSQLAKLLGVSSKAVESWEEGIRMPRSKTLTKIARLFQVSEEYLLGISKQRYDPKIADMMRSFVHVEREL